MRYEINFTRLYLKNTCTGFLGFRGRNLMGSTTLNTNLELYIEISSQNPGSATTRLQTFRLQHFVYRRSSSSTDILSTSVFVSITANQQRPLSYSYAKTCYIFSGIQLLITEKIIFINPRSEEHTS